MRTFKESHNSVDKKIRKHQFRGTENQCTYLQRLRNNGIINADSARVNSQIKVPTVQHMRLHGKKIMELKHSLPHTRIEMAANAPKGIVKAGEATLKLSIQNTTQAKINSWDNMATPKIDILEEAAKKLTAISMCQTRINNMACLGV